MFFYTVRIRIAEIPVNKSIAFCFHYIFCERGRGRAPRLGIFKFPVVVAGTASTLNEEFVDRIFLSFWLRCWEQKGYNNGTVGGKGNTAKGKKNNISAQHLTSPPICSSRRRCHNNSECELTWQKDRRYKIKDNEK